MADFPSNVSTETSSPAYQNQAQGGNSLRGLATSASTVVDMFFLKSIPGILMMVEVVGDAPKGSLCLQSAFQKMPHVTILLHCIGEFALSVFQFYIVT